MSNDIPFVLQKDLREASVRDIKAGKVSVEVNSP